MFFTSHSVPIFLRYCESSVYPSFIKLRNHGTSFTQFHLRTNSHESTLSGTILRGLSRFIKWDASIHSWSGNRTPTVPVSGQSVIIKVLLLPYSLWSFILFCLFFLYLFAEVLRGLCIRGFQTKEFSRSWRLVLIIKN